MGAGFTVACKLKTLGLGAKAVKLYSTTTAGSLDDATASNYEIFGVQSFRPTRAATASAMSAFCLMAESRNPSGRAVA